MVRVGAFGHSAGSDPFVEFRGGGADLRATLHGERRESVYCGANGCGHDLIYSRQRDGKECRQPCR